MNGIINLLTAAIRAGIPLLFGTTGEIITEKSGNMNLGVEGMMWLGAFFGFYAGLHTDSLILALLCAFAAGLGGALIYAVLTVSLRANQTVAGLALTIFGTAFANFFGLRMIADNGGFLPKLSPRLTGILADKPIPLLGKIPYIGKLLFSHNILVYLGIGIAVLAFLYMNKTRAGLRMRAVGEAPATADAAGINVTLTKYIHILLGGGVCGLGGAYLSLAFFGGQWQNACVDGQGWIAVALVIFANWNPVKAILGTLLFGMFEVIRFRVDWLNIPPAFCDMLPYVITTLILVIASIRRSRERRQPQGCGNNYFREDR
ncbi:MAG: ABC transporter permease [Clostridia bacterium]|nr:ABC transporter permease [Oscillospiraceae bacterium]MBQ7033302.1 ABC transporter permease [Clostridia bacterium]